MKFPSFVGAMHSLRHVAAVLASGFVFSQACFAQTPALIPAKAFFAAPRVVTAQLSPTGKRLALTTAGEGGRLGLYVIELDEPGKNHAAVQYSDIDVRRFYWVGDERLVYDLIDTASGAAEQSDTPGLFSVRFDGAENRQLILMNQGLGVNRYGRGADRVLSAGHHLLHVPANAGDEVIVGAYQGDRRGALAHVEPMWLNVATGHSRPLRMKTPDDVIHWLFDGQGRARALVQRVGSDKLALRWRPLLEATGSGASSSTSSSNTKEPAEPTFGDWQTLLEHDRLATPFVALEVDDAGTFFGTRLEGRGGHRVLTQFDVAQRKPAAQAMLSTPGFDFTGSFLRERAGGPLLGLRVTTDAQNTVWFDENMKRAQAVADARWPNNVNQLDCKRCSDKDAVVLVRTWSDRDPGQLWLYRPGAQQEPAPGTATPPRPQWQLISTVRPGLDPNRMATVALERIAARDGRELPVWFTFPAALSGVSPGGAAPAAPPAPKPTVVLVHGGPWVRGTTWQWSAMEQFLASRGYLVISPEFRGSAGYGQAHQRAGYKQFGRAMQDDVADALQWAQQKGWAGKACIMGASYGGYASLMGPVRHPDTYQCAVAWVAMADLFLYLEGSFWTNDDIGDFGRERVMPQRVGDADKDRAMLSEVSPVLQAARIKRPVLLAYGERDLRVPLKHGERMRDALRAAGNEPEWVVYPGEAHTWMKEATHVDFATRVEKFLGQHLR